MRLQRGVEANLDGTAVSKKHKETAGDRDCGSVRTGDEGGQSQASLSSCKEGLMSDPSCSGKGREQKNGGIPNHRALPKMNTQGSVGNA